MGKPAGTGGGSWNDSDIKKNIPSDPYLIGFYDKKELTLAHRNRKDIVFTVEVDPTGNSDWMEYTAFTVKGGEPLKHSFPDSFEARWIRFIAGAGTKATARLVCN